MLLLKPSGSALQSSRLMSPSETTRLYQKYTVVALIILGALYRLFHFFYNRSLFIDELYLNINLIKMSFWELATQPFEYQQKAPIGYLWATKLCVLLFGKGEKALRLFPLLCGLSSLVLFVPVARYYLKSWGVVVAVGILSLSWAIIYHSAEAKQYSTELFASVLALLLYTKYHRSPSVGSMIIWGFAGSTLLWFSFSLIFVLAGIATATSLNALLKKQWNRFFIYLIPFSMWLVSFGLLYYFFLNKYPQAGWLIYFFQKEYDAFMPLHLQSFSDVIWFIKKPYSLLHYPLGSLLHIDNEITNGSVKFILKLGWVQFLFILFGMIMVFIKDKVSFFTLFLPIAIVFLASGFKLYPIFARFALFFAPLIILFLAFGVEKIIDIFSGNIKVALLLLALSIGPALANSTSHVIHPELLVKIANAAEREGIFYINDNFREGDAVYVFWNMRHAYNFYKEAYGLKYNATQGSYVKSISRSPEEYIKNLSPDFQNFKGKKRLWYIYNTNNKDDIGEYIGQPAWYSQKGYVAPLSVENELSKLGKKVYEHRIYHQRIVLYELNP